MEAAPFLDTSTSGLHPWLHPSPRPTAGASALQRPCRGGKTSPGNTARCEQWVLCATAANAAAGQAGCCHEGNYTHKRGMRQCTACAQVVAAAAAGAASVSVTDAPAAQLQRSDSLDHSGALSLDNIRQSLIRQVSPRAKQFRSCCIFGFACKAQGGAGKVSHSLRL